MQTVDGKKIRDGILTEIKNEVRALPFVPVFCDVLVGDDLASVKYVDMKMKSAESVGMSFHKANFPDSITTEKLVKEIKTLNQVPNICGIIVQLPLPKSIDKRTVLNAIDPRLDVDCLGAETSEKFYSGQNVSNPPAARACISVLESLNLDLKNKKIVVLGQGDLVGKPVAALLRFKGLSPIVVDTGTVGKEKIIKEADVIISGIGKGKYLEGGMIKNEAVLIDAGTSESEGGIVGDVDLESVKDMASYVSPVPGGVGPVTVAMLLKNVLSVAKAERN